MDDTEEERKAFEDNFSSNSSGVTAVQQIFKRKVINNIRFCNNLVKIKVNIRFNENL